MVKQKLITILFATLTSLIYLPANAGGYEVNESWQSLIVAATDSFPEGGGYYKGRKTTETFAKTPWRAMNETYAMLPADPMPPMLLERATPSFDAMAVYLAMLKALTMWDTQGRISREAWYWLKPYCGVVDRLNPKGYNQTDGEGCWGRAMSLGPGMAVLLADLKTGFSFTAYRGAKSEKNRESSKEVYLSDEQWINHKVWSNAIPGDMVKIFWNRNETTGSDSGAIIGMTRNTDEDQENSFCAIFLGYTDDGDMILWSSVDNPDNHTAGGYGRFTCKRIDAQRIVFSRVTKPENFDKAEKYNPLIKINEWLQSLRNSHATTKDLIKNAGIK